MAAKKVTVRCEEIQDILESLTPQEIPDTLREHLAICAGCEAYARDWGLVRGGLRQLASEEVPEASPGFVTRLVRRLDESPSSDIAAEFFERVGRRVVFSTLLLALTALLALVVPAAGPLRTPAADLSLAQAEAIPGASDPVFASEYQESPDAAPAKLPGQGNKGEK